MRGRICFTGRVDEQTLVKVGADQVSKPLVKIRGLAVEVGSLALDVTHERATLPRPTTKGRVEASSR